MISAYAATDPGPVRTVNEDAFLVDVDQHLYAVADGMGGHNAGEVASSLALEALSGFVRRSSSDTDLSWPYGVMPDLSFLANRLRTALHLANRRVFRAAESHDDYTGHGHDRGRRADRRHPRGRRARRRQPDLPLVRGTVATS